MDRSRICVTKSLKAAQGCCRKQNLLVYERRPGDLNPSDCKKKWNPIIPIAHGKPIRVCTGPELKKMCPPKPCKCPPIKYRPGLLHYLSKMLGFAFKIAVVGGLVYLTYDKGVWGTPSKTEEIYRGMCKKVHPVFCPRSLTVKCPKKTRLCEATEDIRCEKFPTPESCTCTPPSLDEESHRVRELWNKLVIMLFSSVAYFPGNVIDLYAHIRDVYEKRHHDDECELNESQPKLGQKQKQ